MDYRSFNDRFRVHCANYLGIPSELLDSPPSTLAADALMRDGGIPISFEPEVGSPADFAYQRMGVTTTIPELSEPDSSIPPAEVSTQSLLENMERARQRVIAACCLKSYTKEEIDDMRRAAESDEVVKPLALPKPPTRRV